MYKPVQITKGQNKPLPKPVYNVLEYMYIGPCIKRMLIVHSNTYVYNKLKNSLFYTLEVYSLWNFQDRSIEF